MNNHWNANAGSANLLADIGVYVCRNRACLRPCNSLHTSLAAVSARLCAECYDKAGSGK